MDAVKVLVAAEGLHAARLIAAVRAAKAQPVIAVVDAQRTSAWAAATDGLAVVRDVRDGVALVAAAQAQGCAAIHVGAGRLGGDALLDQAAQAAGIRIIGPSVAGVAAVSPRHRLRALADQLGIAWDPSRGPGTRTLVVTLMGRPGHICLLGDRETTVHQGDDVIIAEAPAPELPLLLRSECYADAERLAKRLDVNGVLDVRFHIDAEIGVATLAGIAWGPSDDLDALSAAIGLDCHAWAVLLGLGEIPPWEHLSLRSASVGVAVRVGVATSAPRGPGSGCCTRVVLPADVVAAIAPGNQPGLDGPRLALVSASGDDRDAAFSAVVERLRAVRLDGVVTDIPRLLALIASPAVRQARYAPALALLVDTHAPLIQVLEPGLQSTVQDLSGRRGLWSVGVPPSGPMDPLSFRIANAVVGNSADAAGIEITYGAASFRFPQGAVIALAGARCAATLEGAVVTWHTAVTVPPGGTLRLGGIGPVGMRTALAVRGGVDVPPCLGSRSTFTLGGFGGFAGRALLRGDELAIGDAVSTTPTAAESAPELTKEWTIGVLVGPHAAPEFLTASGLEQFLAADWQVSPQSNRTGVRLIGPKPGWARSDGGEAGLHPSNIHDNAYALGSIDLTGDMPVILGPDGPSLGGFVCPAVVVQAERWKLGQLRPGDRVRFHTMGLQQAGALRQRSTSGLGSRQTESPILHHEPAGGSRPALCIRRAGDDHLLVEVGERLLDIAYRLRVQALHDRVRAERLAAITDLTPGVRSLQLQYDPDRISEADLVRLVIRLDRDLGDTDALTVPSRTVYLPLSWDDPSTRKAIDIYQRTVNPNAPWCPWNIEFIRRINGLTSVDDVQRTVFGAEYLVLGLGDVYLGAPVATPVDPRHRLVTTKYNPARTWTPENAVGIGGAYLCIYGMEGPGGYQFVGRTIQVWNTWRSTAAFTPGKPWLLRQFDRIRFFPVEANELLRLREDFPHGRYAVRTEEGSFSLFDHRRFLASNADSIAALTATRDAAFAAERARWDKLPLGAAP